MSDPLTLAVNASSADRSISVWGADARHTVRQRSHLVDTFGFHIDIRMEGHNRRALGDS